MKRFSAVNKLCLAVLFAAIISSSTTVASLKGFAGLGPVFFHGGAIGYLQAGAEYDWEQTGKFSFTVGPLVGIAFGKRFFSFDLDGFIKANYRIELNKKYGMTFYGKLPLGLSLGWAGGFFNLGFNIGLIPGLQFHLNDKLSFFAELGFIHHSYWFTRTGINTSSHLPAGMFNVGVSYLF